MKIRNYEITAGSPALIIAEISGNHSRNFDKAVMLAKKALEAGADAVKTQTYKPSCLTLKLPSKYNIVHHLWGGQSYYHLYEKTAMPWTWNIKIRQLCHTAGKLFGTTVYSKAAVEWLENFCPPDFYKIASFEIEHVPLLTIVAATGRPVILSAALAAGNVVSFLKKNKNHDNFAVLNCSNVYPARAGYINPDFYKTFKRRQVLYGLSDHTLSSVAAIFAIQQGAKIFEKHFMLDKYCQDRDFSLNPKQFKQYVADIREAEEYGKLKPADLESGKNHYRSIWVTVNVESGTRISAKNIGIFRPGNGMSPLNYKKLITGQYVFTKTLTAGTPLLENMISSSAGFPLIKT